MKRHTSTWMKRQFEFENCAECGGDERDHEETELLGNPFAHCRVEIYDNGGETFDRFTIILDDDYVFGMSENPFHPQGFSQFCGQLSYDELSAVACRKGIKKTFNEVPEEVARAIRDRY